MFWENFIKLCTENNTKPNPVAAKLGISSGSVTNWKNGTMPNSATLMKIANYFNVSPDYLLGRTDEPTPPKTQPIVIMAKGGKGQDVIEVTEEQYKKIKKLLEIMDEDN